MSAKSEAKRFIRDREREWREDAAAFARTIHAIEDSILRYAVAGSVDAVSSGSGAVLIRKNEDGAIEMSGLTLDEDVFDVMVDVLRSMGSEEPEADLQRGGDWILARWREENPSIAYVNWLLGAVEPDPDAPPITDTLVTAGKIVYSIPDGCVVGVLNGGRKLIYTGYKSRLRDMKFHQKRQKIEQSRRIGQLR